MNVKRTLILIVGLLFGAWLVLSVLNAPMDTLPKLVILALAAVIVGAVSLLRRPLVTLIVLVVLAVLIVIGINLEAIITGAGNVLTYIFSPESRVETGQVVVCSQDSACSTIWSFGFSLLLLLGFITGFAYTTLLERRFVAWFQHRIGPNRVGPLGLLQPLADAIKLIFKEDIVPQKAYFWVWLLAPMLKVVPVLLVLGVIPLGPNLLIPWFDGKWYEVSLALADLNVGVLWLLGITSIGIYGVVLAGWSSNNKYAMLGGLRSSAQMISYELSLGLTMAVPVMIVGSMNLKDIVNAQAAPPVISWFVFQNPLAAAILMIALVAEINRAPFDMPEAEQELTAGYDRIQRHEVRFVHDGGIPGHDRRQHDRRRAVLRRLPSGDGERSANFGAAGVNRQSHPAADRPGVGARHTAAHPLRPADAVWLEGNAAAGAAGGGLDGSGAGGGRCLPEYAAVRRAVRHFIPGGGRRQPVLFDARRAAGGRRGRRRPGR
ncbi:MAG: hypothetical protein BroJett038_04310 [Chloroflexota bacterium]|nr:MAG: hypothetical protein BroJett038_04310 [Chloroflexota bacterium]